jgi:hypothetical protein
MTEKTGQTPKNIPDHVEDVPNGMIDTTKVLTDDELAAGGVVPVQAFMRTRASKNAIRKRKQAQRAEKGADGRAPRKQLNIVAPADPAARDALKRVAERLVDGDLSPSDLDLMGRVDNIRLGDTVSKALIAGGLRAVLLRKLLKLKN